MGFSLCIHLAFYSTDKIPNWKEFCFLRFSAMSSLSHMTNRWEGRYEQGEMEPCGDEREVNFRVSYWLCRGASVQCCSDVVYSSLLFFTLSISRSASQSLSAFGHSMHQSNEQLARQLLLDSGVKIMVLQSVSGFLLCWGLWSKKDQ